MQANTHSEQTPGTVADIKLLLLDVDGVLTDGKLYFTSTGEEIKAFNTQDGHGIRMLMASGIMVGIITGRSSPAVAARARDLGIEILYQNQKNKLDALQEIATSLHLSPLEIAYAGDDLPDLPVMKTVGLSFAVANAHVAVSETASFVTSRSGGAGAVREIADFLLQEQGKYQQFLN